MSPDGSSIESLGDDTFVADGPEALIVDTDGTYVLIDETEPALYRIDPTTGAPTLIFAGSPDPFSSDGPQGIALASNGDYLVADEGDRIIQVARDGSSATTISSGSPLSGPRDLAVYDRCGPPLTPTPPSPTPTTAPSEAAPAAELPSTGGTPLDGGSISLLWLAAIAGVMALAASGGAWFAYQGRRIH
jgi:hypothetical protein